MNYDWWHVLELVLAAGIPLLSAFAFLHGKTVRANMEVIQNSIKDLRVDFDELKDDYTSMKNSMHVLEVKPQTCPFHDSTKVCISDIREKVSSLTATMEALKEMGAFHSHNGK